MAHEAGRQGCNCSDLWRQLSPRNRTPALLTGALRQRRAGGFQDESNDGLGEDDECMEDHQGPPGTTVALCCECLLVVPCCLQVSMAALIVKDHERTRTGTNQLNQ